MVSISKVGMIPPIGVVSVGGQVRGVVEPILVVKIGCISLGQISNGLVFQNRTGIGRMLMRSTKPHTVVV